MQGGGSYLEFRGVKAGYGKKTVVSDINLSIPRGVTFGLIGLNGAGKTTLIKTLLGLRGRQGGDILIDGGDSLHKDGRRQISYLPERFDPPSFMTGEEFIRFSANLYGATVGQDIMNAMSVQLKLPPDVLKNRMTTYSKGMRQKAGLMATVLTGCGLLVLDEPMSGLDPSARAAVKDVLRQLKREGRTVFFSSHILADMDEICEHVAILHAGRIVFDGTPAELKARHPGESLESAFLSLIGQAEARPEAA